MIFYIILLISNSFCSSYIKEFENYRVEIAGISNANTLQIIKGYSLLLLNYKNEDKGFGDIRSIAKYDADSLSYLLKSLGYIKANVSSSVDIKDGKPHIFFYAWEGHAYKVMDIIIIPLKKEWKEAVNIVKEIEKICEKFSEKAFASTRQINEIEQYILTYMQNNGLPFSSITSIKILANHRNKTVNLAVSVDTGPMSFFGKTQIEGTKTISSKMISNRIPWFNGDKISKQLIIDTRNALIRTGLFKEVDISIPSMSTEVPICKNVKTLVTISEASHKSIRFSSYLDSNKLFSIKLNISHKNIDHYGGRLNLSTKLSSYFAYISASFDKSVYYRHTVPIKFLSNLISGYQKILSIHKNSDAEIYRYKYLNITEVIHNSEGNLARASLAINYRIVDLKTGKKLLPPNSNIHQSSHNILALTLHLSGCTSETTQIKENFLALYIKANCCFDVKTNNKWATVTGKATIHTNTLLSNLLIHSENKIGIIIANTIDDIPIFDRFYIGGKDGGKGYPYATISPMNIFNVAGKQQEEPTGGLLFITSSLEMWYAYKNNLAIIHFIDFSFCSSSINNSVERIYYSYGIATLYAPGNGMYIRMDIVIPTTFRSQIDSKCQALISFGNYIQHDVIQY